MKKIAYLFIVFVLFWISAKSQNNASIKTIPVDYCTSNETPKLLTLGDTIVITCDSVYLINKIRYKFYKEIHLALQKDNNSECKDLLQAYENRLSEHESTYNKLLINSKKTEKISLDLIDYTQKSLENTQKTLDYTQLTLEQSMKSLDQANELIKKEKWNSKGQKLLVGIGGVGVGILVGVLIMK
jgi:ElaB/YqjD/DUF883 family membrane-anchored ribosome-binding protein